MSFDKTFCPSPWIHTGINNLGEYEYCRWAVKDRRESKFGTTINDKSPKEYFQEEMSEIRLDLLNGKTLPGCNECSLMERHGKVSGREKQLLKIGVVKEDPILSLRSSPWIREFKNSLDNNGIIKLMPQDWQINLGNYCNSGCVFCSPHASSTLETEFKKIGWLEKSVDPNWTTDVKKITKFVNSVADSKIEYIHFIGGETLITPAFKTILKSLVDLGIGDDLNIGFTTNLTIWKDEIIDLFKKFKSIHVGVSVECLHPVNDYIRYGSKIDVVKENLDRWCKISKENHWLMQIRTTPTLLSIMYLDDLYEYAYNNLITIESCNFIDKPEFLRPSVLPEKTRKLALEKLKKWISSKNKEIEKTVINVRNINFVHAQLLQDAESYVNYLENQEYETSRLSDTVVYLKTLEKSRGNSILNYLPEYEELFRSVGY